MMVRNGALDPEPIAGLPEISSAGGGGLMSAKVHPQFAENSWVYLSYTKSAPAGRRAVGMDRGRLSAATKSISFRPAPTMADHSSATARC